MSFLRQNSNQPNNKKTAPNEQYEKIGYIIDSIDHGCVGLLYHRQKKKEIKIFTFFNNIFLFLHMERKTSQLSVPL